MNTREHSNSSRVAFVWVVSGCIAFQGCADRSPTETREIPDEIVKMLPPSFKIAHEEAGKGEIGYHLWIVHASHSSLVHFPKKRKSIETHMLPGQVLAGYLEAKAPTLDVGSLRDGTCRYTHWSQGQSEFMIREAVVDGRWLATVETVLK